MLHSGTGSRTFLLQADFGQTVERELVSSCDCVVHVPVSSVKARMTISSMSFWIPKSDSSCSGLSASGNCCPLCCFLRCWGCNGFACFEPFVRVGIAWKELVNSSRPKNAKEASIVARSQNFAGSQQSLFQVHFSSCESVPVH